MKVYKELSIFFFAGKLVIVCLKTRHRGSWSFFVLKYATRKKANKKIINNNFWVTSAFCQWDLHGLIIEKGTDTSKITVNLL